MRIKEMHIPVWPGPLDGGIDQFRVITVTTIEDVEFTVHDEVPPILRRAIASGDDE